MRASVLHIFIKQMSADAFDTERAELLRRFTSSSSASESHSLRCTAQKRAEEVRELQHALSAAHVHLFEERDRLLRLQGENDELRMQEAEDRRRIKHLAALTNPVDQEVTLQPGAQPTSGIFYPRQKHTKRHGPGVASASRSTLQRPEICWRHRKLLLLGVPPSH